MIKVDDVRIIPSVPDTTVYGDDDSDHKFYILPDELRYRIDENAHPVFKFVKYKNPIDRGNGKLGGGFCFFDVEFVVTGDKQQKVVNFLQDQLNHRFAQIGQPPPQVEVGTVNYTKGTASLNLQSIAGGFVEKVYNPGLPSLYGNNVCSFSVELSPEGATLFEQIMQGGGGVVQ